MHLPRMLTLAALAATAVAAAPPPPTPPLRVTAIPEARDDFQKNEALFTAWLGRQTGVPVVLRLAGSYEEAVVHPIVIREKDREFKSYVIAASSLEARSVQALRGKRFTFGSPLSTSGHVMPRFFLLQQGLVPEKFFGSVAYSGDHKKTVLAIASGQQDCGAVNYKVFDQMVADKAVDPTKSRWCGRARSSSINRGWPLATSTADWARACSRRSPPPSWPSTPRGPRTAACSRS
jgi:ABC-type phosphate/phosphonate transport system substrate-binding protein